MDPSQLVDAIDREVSPRMTLRGFGPGGSGRALDGTVSFLYCIGAQVFSARWPSVVDMLAVHTEVRLDAPGWCLDLVIQTSASGELERVDVEWVDLAELLRMAAQLDLASRCDVVALSELPEREVASTIAEAIDALLPIDRVTNAPAPS